MVRRSESKVGHLSTNGNGFVRVVTQTQYPTTYRRFRCLYVLENMVQSMDDPSILV